MSCLNPFDVQSRHIVTTDGHAETLYAGHGARGGKHTCWCIGNGQAQQTELHEQCLCLNCMHDPMAIMKERKEMEEYDVRRLTPTECARLQGFPPDWCADVPHSDSAEYKLWGNGIALPSILGIMQNAVRVVKEYKHEHIQR